MEIRNLEGYTQSLKRKYGDMFSVIEALGKTNDPKVIPYLCEVFKSNDPDIRITVIEALGKIEGPDALKQLFFALDDSTIRVRIAAVTTLGKIGRIKSYEVLQTKKETEPTVIAAITQAMQQIMDRQTKITPPTTDYKNTIGLGVVKKAFI